MPLAVVQNDLSDPSAEQLVEAFRALPELTDHDAVLRARDVSGVIADRLDERQAQTLFGALALQGVPVAIIDEAQLPELPPAYRSREVWPSPDGLTIYDTLNRPLTHPWAHVTLIAAGLINRGQFVTVSRPRVALQGDRGNHYVTHDRSNYEQQETQPVIQVLLSADPFRVELDAGKLRYGYQSDNRSIDVIDRYETLVLDLTRFAPHAQINRGADTIIRSVLRRTYRSERVFEREIAWLLWLTGSRD